MTLTPVYRITVFVPATHLEALKAGLCAVDPLASGDYDQVMWSMTSAEEQFRPLPGAHPAQGRIGEVTRVPSVRLEFAIPRDPQRLQRVLDQGIRPHHPWEVPAIFVDESWAAWP